VFITVSHLKVSLTREY